MNTSTSSLHLVSPHMELSDQLWSPNVDLLGNSTKVLGDGNNLTICTPHIGITNTVLKEVACRRKEARKTRRFGGCRSEIPFARRRLVF